MAFTPAGQFYNSLVVMQWQRFHPQVVGSWWGFFKRWLICHVALNYLTVQKHLLLLFVLFLGFFEFFFFITALAYVSGIGIYVQHVSPNLRWKLSYLNTHLCNYVCFYITLNYLQNIYWDKKMTVMVLSVRFCFVVISGLLHEIFIMDFKSF